MTNALILIPVFTSRSKAGNRSLEGRGREAEGLALSISLNIAAVMPVKIITPKPSTLFGEGKVREIEALVTAHAIGLVIVDGVLSPIQQRNLEKSWNCKVIDRTALILEIFGERAQTAEGKLQVELAALNYQKSRLVRSWTHLERQRGGFGFLGGPGETQLEVDKRIIRTRISTLERDLETVRRTRALHRAKRRKNNIPVIALVGYTNSGKSTLFNALTSAGTYAANKLFATLDPAMRAIKLPLGQEVIISDTVGFVSNLPTELVAAFRATLEEVSEADLIVHVRDVHHHESAEQKADVLSVLKSLNLEDKLSTVYLEVLNKVDLLGDDEQQALLTNENQIAVSALHSLNLDTFLNALDARLTTPLQTASISVSAANGRTIAWIKANCRILEETGTDDLITFSLQAPSRIIEQLTREMEGSPAQAGG